MCRNAFLESLCVSLLNINIKNGMLTEIIKKKCEKQTDMKENYEKIIIDEKIEHERNLFSKITLLNTKLLNYPNTLKWYI